MSSVVVITESPLAGLWHALLGLFLRRRRQATATEIRLLAQVELLQAELADRDRIIAVQQKEKESMAGTISNHERHIQELADWYELSRRRIQSWTAMLSAQEAMLTTSPPRGMM